MTITDSELLRMLARAERDEETWADATRRCGSADNARRFGRATKAAEMVRNELSRRVVAAAEAMLEE
jgi:hypothetical protein